MKTFEVYLKGRTEPVMVQGDEVVIHGDLFRCRIGATATAEFARSETQGWMEVEKTVIPQITFVMPETANRGRGDSTVNGVEPTDIE